MRIARSLNAKEDRFSHLMAKIQVVKGDMIGALASLQRAEEVAIDMQLSQKYNSKLAYLGRRNN